MQERRVGSILDSTLLDCPCSGHLANSAAAKAAASVSGADVLEDDGWPLLGPLAMSRSSSLSDQGLLLVLQKSLVDFVRRVLTCSEIFAAIPLRQLR